MQRLGLGAPHKINAEAHDLGRRGPAPESLSRLFTLEYQEGIKDRKELATRLGVSAETIGKYERRLNQKLVRLLGQVSKERLEFVCPECLEPKVFEDPETGERVCHSCGYAQPGVERADENLAFDTTYALESDLAIDKSLGGTLGKRGVFQMLCKNNGPVDLGIRARQVRIMSGTNPSLAKILERAYGLSKRFNMEGDKLFNNDLGRNARRAFWLAKELEVPIDSAAETAFWVTTVQYEKKNLISKTKGILKVNPTLLNLTMKINHLLTTAKNESAVDTEDALRTNQPFPRRK
jgi:transcriptional regulator with XRE-family HTH domain